MNSAQSNALPTNELRKDTPHVFRNDPDEKPPATLRDPRIAEMAFRATWADKLGDPGIGMLPVSKK